MSQLHVFDKVVQGIIDKKKIKDEGGYIGIPYPFESLNKTLGAIEKSTVIGITANSGVSKSKFTRFVYIYNVYQFYKKTNYAVKIIYFPLEDSHEEIVHNMICFYLKDRYDMNISVQHLNQLGDYDVSMATIQRIKEARGYFADLYNILEVIDYASTVTEIYNIGRSWAAINGEIEESKKDGLTEVTAYRQKNEVHTIFIIDNLSNILAEARHKGDEREAIGELVRIYCRKILAQKFGFTVVVVQQQSQSKEKIQHSNNGKLLFEKFEPSLGDLADNLTTQRAFHLAFGIFSPERYGIEEYWGYDIDILGGFFRAIKILKSNKSGSTGKIIPLWFNGSSEHYEQMPNPPIRRKDGPSEPISAELDMFYKRAAMIRGRQASYQLEL